jgi:hypothetical protein
VAFYTKRVMQAAQAAADDVVTALAFQVEGQAKINVRENGQIDTGFMLNSIYTVAPEGNTYRQAWSTGDYASTKGEGAEHRELGGEMSAREHVALVVVGAEYGLFQETRNSFLYRALDMVSADSPDVTVRQM